MGSQTKIEGFVEVRKNGLLLAQRPNLVVDAGLSLLASIIESASPTRPSHMAIGSSATAVAGGQTALQGTEHERVAVSTARTDALVEYTAQFGSGISGTVTVNEMGIFNAAAAGTMLARFLTGSFTADSSDTIDVVWGITFV